MNNYDAHILFAIFGVWTDVTDSRFLKVIFGSASVFWGIISFYLSVVGAA